jgi:hypothetical protein
VTYSQQRVLAIAVTVCLGMLGAVALGNAETLGISPRILAWLSVFSTGLGILAGFLPNVRGTDQKPEHIANRIMELTPVERAELQAEVERRGPPPPPSTPPGPPPPPPPPPPPMDRAAFRDVRFP